MAPKLEDSALLSAVNAAQAKIIEIAITLFLGYLILWGLFGVLSAQVYLFYIAFPNELLSRRILVYGIYCFELTQVILLTISGVQTFGLGWGDPAALDRIGSIYISVPLMGSIVAFVVQAFYAYRIWVLAENRWAPILVLTFAMIGLGGGIAMSIVGGLAKVFSRFLGTTTTITTTFWNGGAALCDVVIAVLMIIYLSRRSLGVWRSTQDRVSRIIRLVIETGTLTALVAAINLVLSVLPSHPTYYQITSCMLGKLYSNSMMVMLNSRMRIGRLTPMDTDAAVEPTDDKPTAQRFEGDGKKGREGDGHFRCALSTLMFKSAPGQSVTETNIGSDFSGTRLITSDRQQGSTLASGAQDGDPNQLERHSIDDIRQC